MARKRKRLLAPVDAGGNKRRRPDVAERRALNKASDFSVVRVSVKSFMSNSALALPWASVLFDMNKATKEASLLANVRVMLLIQGGKPIPPLDCGFFYQCLSAVSVGAIARKNIVDVDLRNAVALYKSWRSPNVRYADSTNLSSGWFQFASRRWAVNTSNHILQNFYPRLKKYVTQRFGLSGIERYRLLKSVLLPTYAGSDTRVITMRGWIPRNLFGWLDTDHPNRILPVTYRFLEFIEAENIARRHDTSFKQLRLFSLLPLKRGFQCSNFQMCKLGLRGLLRRAGVHVPPVERPRGGGICWEDVAGDWWYKLFKIKQFETATRKFAGWMETDGKAVSIVLRRPKPIQEIGQIEVGARDVVGSDLSGAVSIPSGSASGGASGSELISSGSSLTETSGSISVLDCAGESGGGNVSVSDGSSSSASSMDGSISAVGGDGCSGGSVSLVGGQSSSTTGASVRVLSGGGSSVSGSTAISSASGPSSGDVVMSPGSATGASAGNTNIAVGSSVHDSGRVDVRGGSSADGADGDVQLNGGASVATTASSSTVAGGLLLVGESSASAQAGGVVSLSGGSGSQLGGGVTVTSGTGSSASGDAVFGSSSGVSSVTSGAVWLSSGSTVSAASGDVNVRSGDSSSGASGRVRITGGASGSSRGGDVSLFGGSSGGGVSSGSLSLENGAGGSGSSSGDVSVQSGVAFGSSSSGLVSVRTGSSESGSSGALSLLTGDGSSGSSGSVALGSGSSGTPDAGNVTIVGGSTNSANSRGGSAMLSSGPEGVIRLNTGVRTTALGSSIDIRAGESSNAAAGGANVVATGGSLIASCGVAGGIALSGGAALSSSGSSTGEGTLVTGGDSVAGADGTVGIRSGVGGAKSGVVEIASGSGVSGSIGSATLGSDDSARSGYGAVKLQSGASADASSGNMTVSFGGLSSKNVSMSVSSGSSCLSTVGSVCVSGGGCARYCEVWGIDPGRREMIVATSNSGHHMHCSSKEFYHEARYTASNKTIRHWIDHDQFFSEAICNMPTPKTTSLGNLERYVRFLVPRLDRLLDFRMKKPFRKLRFRRFLFAKKKLRKICEQLTANARGDTIVGYGNWSATDFGGVIKKCPPGGPVKRLERELKRYCHVISVPEFRTSQLHADCLRFLTYQYAMHICKDGVKRPVKIHSVLHCRNSGCKGTTVNRDQNASKNILLQTEYHLLHGSWYPAFTP